MKLKSTLSFVFLILILGACSGGSADDDASAEAENAMEVDELDY